MKRHCLLAMILLAIPCSAIGQEDESKARTLAQEILDRGATLFDTRDAAAMAATYVEGGQVLLVKRNSDQGDVEIETISGRAAIEKGYSDLFKDRLPEHKSRNTVESARFLGADYLLIQGRFSLNRDQGDSVQFVQLRTRQGEQWKIVTMQLIPMP